MARRRNTIPTTDLTEMLIVKNWNEPNGFSYILTGGHFQFGFDQFKKLS